MVKSDFIHAFDLVAPFQRSAAAKKARRDLTRVKCLSYLGVTAAKNNHS